MERLPFLVEHGDAVWKVLAATAALAAIALVRWARDWWERRATAHDVAARAACATAPVEGVATLRGTLRGGRASSVSLLHLHGRKPYYDERAPALWLDCDGQRVTLVGLVRVIRGSRLVSTRDRRSALPDDEPAVRSTPILHRLAATATSVRDGDPVFVTAQLVARPGGEPISYREATTAWTATPHGDAIEIVAAVPAVRATPRGIRRMAASGLAGAALAVAAMWATGAAAMWWTLHTTSDTGSLVPVALGELDAIAIAAATPGHRTEALAVLETRLATRHQRTAEAFALWRGVARLRGGCGAEIAVRIAQDEITGLAQLAKRCDDHRAAGDAFQYLGLFHDAVARDRDEDPGKQHIESLLAVRAWNRAESWAAYRRGDPFDDDLPRAPRAGAYQCAGEWFYRMAEIESEAGAQPLSPTSFVRRDAMCEVFAALSTPENERAAALAKVESTDGSLEHTANVLAWARGAPVSLPGVMPSASQLHSAMFDPGDRMAVARALLSALASQRDRNHGDAHALAELAVWRSFDKLLRNEVGNARALARYASEHESPQRETIPLDVPREALAQYEHGSALAVALALRLGGPLPSTYPYGDGPREQSPLPPDPNALWWRYASWFWRYRPELAACNQPALGTAAGNFPAAVLRAARDGDGRAMADLLARCRRRGTPVLEAMFAVWPRIEQGRDQLAEVLRRIDLGPPATDPLAVIGRAALRRDLARLIGDDRAVDAWQEIIDRHLTAFSRERPLIALVTRELLRAAEP